MITSKTLYETHICTPLGEMIAIADETYLYLLDFSDSKYIQAKTNKIKGQSVSFLHTKTPFIIEELKKELAAFFAGSLKVFNTNIRFMGSAFQLKVWETLRGLPYGSQCSYQNLAKLIANPKGFRAVANANAANYFSILVPCHRVISSSGHLGGYAGGVARKEWLLNHEKNMLLQA